MLVQQKYDETMRKEKMTGSHWPCLWHVDCFQSICWHMILQLTIYYLSNCSRLYINFNLTVIRNFKSSKGTVTKHEHFFLFIINT
jgi:hypothetical protein